MGKRGKIGLLSAIFAILLISVLLILSAVSTSNTKEYDSINKIVTIKDSSGNVISDITLNTPLNYMVPRGYQKVAEYEINSLESLKILVSKMELYDKKDYMKPINRVIDYKIKEIKQVEVNDYETICEDYTSTNGTYENCTQKLIGSHLENRITWNDLNKVDFDKGEKIIVGLFTDVQKGDKIEWIPTFKVGTDEFRIDEWATWTESLNVDLISYYTLNGTSGSVVDSLNANPGTNVGAVRGATGKINNSFDFTKSDPDRVEISDGGNITFAVGTDEFTVSLWFNADSFTGTQSTMIQNRNGINAGWSYMIYIDGTDNLRYSSIKDDFTTTNSLTGPVITAGGWNLVTVSVNTTHLSLYLNDSLVDSTALTSQAKTTSGGSNIGGWFGGLGWEATNSFDGRIDEVGIWNRSLSQVEIEQLYNNGDGITYTNVFDTTPPQTTTPTISPSAPITSDDLECSATLTDAEQTDLTANFTWYKNNVSNFSGVKTGISNNTNTIITTLLAGNTSKGEEWKCGVIPFDGFNFGNESNSSSVTILNSAPTHGNPTLTTLNNQNLSTQNLTCNPQNLIDADNDAVVNITNWFKNNQSIFSLLLPFEINTDDYSNNGNDGARNGTSFVIGKLGRALSFDGIDDSVLVQDSNSLDFINKKTWEIWFNRSSTGAETLFNKGNSTESNYKLEFLSSNILKFSYSVIPGTFNFLWITNTQSDFNEGTFNETLFNTSTNVVALNTTSIEQQIFFEGFESGDFATNNWITSADTNNWSVSTTSPFEGTFHAEIIDTGGVGDRSTIEVGISTVGFTNINISYKVQRIGLDAADDFTAEYFNGTGFVIIESNGSVDDLTYQNRSFLLSSDAENNANFKLRFSCVGAAPSEGCRLDNVELRGNGTGFIGSGEYTSKVFDSSKLSTWNNITWSEQLPASTDLVFQVRSCDDASCSGEIFVGPDNTADTNFTNPSFNNVSFILDNRYFQFKAFFSTTDFSISPDLSEVKVSYSQTVSSDPINITSTSQITDTTNFHLATITFDSSGSNNFKFYLDGVNETEKTETVLPGFKNNNLTIGNGFNGILDEFRIYEEALSSEQVLNNFNLNYNKIVSQETQGGDNYICQITPNDGEADGITLNSTDLTVLHAITFNVTDSFSNASLNFVTISCDDPSFNQGGDTTNSYGPFGFSPGSFVCTFSRDGSFGTTKIFTADEDKTVSVPMSEEGQLTIEEHTWLEAIHNCINGGDCSLYNLLLQVNDTVGNIWEHTQPTDESVITFENVTNRVVNSTNNLTIDYSVNIPIKAGYSLGAFLPVRIGFWFLDETNITCFNQGDRPTGVADPYCQPLITEVIGPMGGSVNFTVELQPSLPAGNYSIKRIIDIDPNNVWINYGQEVVSSFTMLESLSSFGVGVEVTGEAIPNSGTESSSSSLGSSSSSSKKTTNVYNTYNTYNTIEQQTPAEDGIIYLNKPGITGGATGTNLLSGWMFVAILTMFTLFFITVIISRTILKLKKK